MMTSSTSVGCRPARAIASLIVIAPSSGAVALDNAPWKPPIAVRAPLTITMSVIVCLQTYNLQRMFKTYAV